MTSFSKKATESAKECDPSIRATFLGPILTSFDPSNIHGGGWVILVNLHEQKTNPIDTPRYNNKKMVTITGSSLDCLTIMVQIHKTSLLEVIIFHNLNLKITRFWDIHFFEADIFCV